LLDAAGEFVAALEDGRVAVGFCTETRELMLLPSCGSYRLMIEPPSSEFGSWATGLSSSILKPGKPLLSIAAYMRSLLGPATGVLIRRALALFPQTFQRLHHDWQPAVPRLKEDTTQSEKA
jgi:hypothetical protein